MQRGAQRSSIRSTKPKPNGSPPTLLNAQPAALELTRQDIETMIDSIGDIIATITEAEPQRLTALYDALRLQMIYDPDSRVVDVTVQPRGRVNSARVRGGTCALTTRLVLDAAA
jgi:hypothetical protein